jgi:uncharacterized protein (TIGR00645 family)
VGCLHGIRILAPFFLGLIIAMLVLLKMKLISAIVAILAVELLKAFLVSNTLTGEQIGWKIAIHLTFVFSGLLFAGSDWISDSRRSA